jgi:carbon storage regulator CsrA
MLVLGRRLNEKLVFPRVQATVQVVDIQGGMVRLGIEAPPEVVVLREELCKPAAGAVGQPPAGRGPGEWERVEHQLREHLNNLGLGLALLRRHLRPELTGAARATLDLLCREYQAAERLLQAGRAGDGRTVPAPALVHPGQS